MLSELRKCMDLMDRRTAIQGGFIALLMMVVAVLEAFGLGLIYAFIRALLEPGAVQSIPVIGNYLSDLSSGSESQLIVILVTTLLGVFIFKNALLLGMYYIQARFIALNEATLAIRLLDHYLHGAYSLHLTRNSADLIRNITGSVSSVFSTVTMSYITLVSELIVVASVGAVLVVLEPVFTLGSIFILGSAVGIFFLFSRSRVQKWGRQEQLSQGGIYKALQQGFHSIKEVKILGSEPSIRASFVEPRMMLAKTRIKFATMSQGPRLWTETVVVTVILCSIIYILSKGAALSEIFSALALFGAATFRLLPSMNRIIMAMNAIRGGKYSVDLIHGDVAVFKSNQDFAATQNHVPVPFDKELAVNGASFSYEGSEQPVLKDLTFSIRPGESIGFVGPSGAGKTTLIDLIAGLLPPTTGSVCVDGQDIYENASGWRRQLGYVPQSIYLMDDTLRQNIAFGKTDTEIDKDRLNAALHLAQLDEIVAGLPEGLDTMMGDRGVRLSGGQRQRVGIARALYNDPAVLIFDEATSALDSETEFEVNNAIQTLKGRKTLIVIAHRLSTVRQCDRLIYLKDGRIEGTGKFDDLAESNPDFRKLVDLARL